MDRLIRIFELSRQVFGHCEMIKNYVFTGCQVRLLLPEPAIAKRSNQPKSRKSTKTSFSNQLLLSNDYVNELLIHNMISNADVLDKQMSTILNIIALNL